MIKGSILNIISKFTDYTIEKLDNYEYFTTKGQEKFEKTLLRMTIYNIYLLLVLYPLVYVPWKISEKKGRSLIFRITLLVTFLFFPFFNIYYIAKIVYDDNKK